MHLHSKKYTKNAIIPTHEASIHLSIKNCNVHPFPQLEFPFQLKEYFYEKIIKKHNEIFFISSRLSLTDSF